LGIGCWTKMHRSVRFSGLESSVHRRYSADFITHYVRIFLLRSRSRSACSGNSCNAVALSSRAAAAAAKGTPAKGDANETLNADRPCRLSFCGNAGILWFSHADCSCQFGHRRNRQFCDSRQGWPRWRPLGQRWLWPRVRLEPRAKSRLAWPRLPSWSLEARALLNRLDPEKRPGAFAGPFLTDARA
jgi:hypothetical protein